MNARIDLKSFTFLACIGKGTYARVVLVRKKNTLGKLFALKILKKKFFRDEKQIERVMTERKILAEADHPFLVKLCYSFQTKDKLYFALDYCPGGEFFSLLCRCPRLTEEQAKFYAAQVVLALEHLHRNNIVYRDLKPQNILIAEDGYIRLTDFGLSRIIQNDEIAFDFCGTLEYLAPELLLHQGHRQPVDWWALGVLVFEMVEGLPPFYVNGNRRQTEFNIKYEQPDLEKISSPNLRSFLQGLLIKNPDQRLGTKGDGEEIKSHPWFEGFEWDCLFNKKITPPFMPKIEGEEDVSNFAREFTDSPVKSFGESGSEDGKAVKGFSFNRSFGAEEGTDFDMLGLQDTE